MKKIKKIYLSIFMLLCGVVLTSNATQMQIQLPDWKVSYLEGKPSLRASGIFENVFWVAGSNNAVFVSKDGGATWNNRSVPSKVLLDFRDIQVFDKNTAIVMGAGEGLLSALYITSDQGLTWSLLHVNDDANGFYNSIAFWDKSRGLLLGDPVDGYYVLKKTLDGGKTWKRIAKVNIPPMLPNESAFAASGNTLIVGGEDKAWFTTGGGQASLYFSKDSGNNWSRHKSPLYNQSNTAGGYAVYQNQDNIFVMGGDYKKREGSYRNLATHTGNTVNSIKSGNRGLKTAMSCEGAICILTGKLSSDISFNYGVSWQPLRQGNVEIGFYTLTSQKMIFLAAGQNGKVGVLSFATKSNKRNKRLRLN